MRQQEAMIVLLNGVCGSNTLEIQKEAYLARSTVIKFMKGEKINQECEDRIGLYIFRKMNSHLLISPEDKE